VSAGDGKPYLSVCAIYRDEAPYLREWIEFHRIVGAERFFLYDNNSEDDHQKLLAPYIERGTVVLRDWPVSPNGQKAAYQHCLEEHRDDSRWIAFIDIDEFLFSPTGAPVAQLLPAYEAWPAVGVNWATYGTSGHRSKPPGPVIESYLYRSDHPEDNCWIKCIVNPLEAVRCRGPHFFFYRDGYAVDEKERPITGPMPFTESVTFERLRINHYRTKSEEEFRARSKNAWPLRQTVQRPDLLSLTRLNEQYDDAILVHSDALRRALEGEDAVPRSELRSS
jgi:hypothetical protein